LLAQIVLLLWTEAFTWPQVFVEVVRAVGGSSRSAKHPERNRKAGYGKTQTTTPGSQTTKPPEYDESKGVFPYSYSSSK
jgi:hypothetical protein